MTGLAQKGGAVVSHVRIAPTPADIHAVRIAAGGANLMLGCDMVVAAGFEALAKMQAGTTRAVINTHKTQTGDFTRDPDAVFPDAEMRGAIAQAVGGGAYFVEATRLATALLGDAMGTNLFVLGYAWQQGLVPLSLAALERAIELNGVAVEMNRQALVWGRRAAHDRARIEAIAAPTTPLAPPGAGHRDDAR